MFIRGWHCLGDFIHINSLDCHNSPIKCYHYPHLQLRKQVWWVPFHPTFISSHLPNFYKHLLFSKVLFASGETDLVQLWLLAEDGSWWLSHLWCCSSAPQWEPGGSLPRAPGRSPAPRRAEEGFSRHCQALIWKLSCPHEQNPFVNQTGMLRWRGGKGKTPGIWCMSQTVAWARPGLPITLLLV